MVHSTVDGVAAMSKCAVTRDHFDWQGDRPSRHATQIAALSAAIVLPATASGLAFSLQHRAHRWIR